MLYLKRVHNVRQTKRNVKLLIIGEKSVGKSSLMKLYDSMLQSSSLMTKPPESNGNKLSFKIKKSNLVYEVDIYKLSLDRAEQYFQSISQSKTTKCLVMIYDTTNLDTFHRIKTFLQRRKPEVSSKTCYKVLIIGNKADLIHSRAVSYDEGKQLSDQLGGKFIEISTQQGFNLELSFALMTSQILQYYQHEGRSRVDYTLSDLKNILI